MTVYLPTPYPDELLYSVFARHFVHADITATTQILERCFGRSFFVNAIMPHRLDYFIDRCSKTDVFDAQNVLHQMTLFPYLTSAISEHARMEYGRAVITGDIPKSRARLKHLWPRPDRKQVLHYCKACAHEDLQRFGETYWRRSNQLVLVMRCPTHGQTLLPSLALTQTYGRRGYLDATVLTMRHRPAPARTLDGDAESLALLAERAITRLQTGTRCGASSSGTADAPCGERASATARLGRGKVKDIARGMTRLYGNVIFEFLQASEQTDVERAILSYVHCGVGSKVTTLELLLEIYFEASGSTKGNITPTVECGEDRETRADTGVTSPQACARSAPSDPAETVSHGVRSRRRTRRKPPRTEEERWVFRREWRNAVDHATAPKITNAMRQNASLYVFLRKHDRAWMEEESKALYRTTGGRMYKGDRAEPKSDDGEQLRLRQRSLWREAVRKTVRPQWSNAILLEPTIYNGLLKHDRLWMDTYHLAIREEELRAQDTAGTRWKVRDEQLLRELEELMEVRSQTPDAGRLSFSRISAVLGLPDRTRNRVPLTMSRIDRYLREGTRPDDKRDRDG